MLTFSTIFVLAATPVSKPATAPLVCSRGARDGQFRSMITMPRSAATGATFTVRIDSQSSGKVSHGGLEYLHDMTTDYLIPEGTAYVDGTAHIVAKTGTANVQPGARVWQEGGTIHYVLPAHVTNNSSYTPPSIQFELKVDASHGSKLALKLAHYEVKAHAIIVGDVTTTCDPSPKPYTIAMVSVP